MREIRQSGSEGGGPKPIDPPYPSTVPLARRSGGICDGALCSGAWRHRGPVIAWSAGETVDPGLRRGDKNAYVTRNAEIRFLRVPTCFCRPKSSPCAELLGQAAHDSIRGHESN